MNQINKRSAEKVTNDIKQAVNRNICSEYRSTILVSVFVTGLMLILYMFLALTSFKSSAIILSISFLSIAMSLILWQLQKKLSLQSCISVQNLQQEIKIAEQHRQRTGKI